MPHGKAEQTKTFWVTAKMFFLFFFIVCASGAPSYSVGPQNVVTVPPNCPAGQEYINGQCRDVWRGAMDPKNTVTVPPNCPDGQEYINGECRDVWSSDPKNVVTVPPNCPDGQEYINGQCRDVWKGESDLKNVITVPPNCAAGQEYINGQCRDVWRMEEMATTPSYSDASGFNAVTVPANCPPGQQLINGACRQVWKADELGPSNVVTVPPNCPDGQEYINGQCRDVWKTLQQQINDLRTLLFNSLGEQVIGSPVRGLQSDRNVISVPNQCPAGYRPDANGICREIIDFRL